jgi:RNA polymerase primary sigma factor
VAARARFLIWLAQHADPSTIRPPGAGGLIPVHAAMSIAEIAMLQRRLFRELGREPTPEELAAELGTDPD